MIKNTIRSIIFILIFLIGCLNVNIFQILIQPLKFLNIRLYNVLINYSKSSFIKLILINIKLFSKTKIILTFNENIKLNDLSNQLVLISNHQIYADWLYIWSLLYYLNYSSNLFIILKNSLKYIPILGWGMTFFEFIFLKRSWSTDKQSLLSSLSKLSTLDKFCLLLFPEGTTLNKNSRLRSVNFAKKINIQDLNLLLLPRLTGLFHSLRTLSVNANQLQLVDLTIAYPGIPNDGLGGEHIYTLNSVFLKSSPPPSIHFHLNIYYLDQIPLGDIHNMDKIDEDTQNFDKWLRNLWIEKDNRLSYFHDHQTFDKSNCEQTFELELKKFSHYFDAFIWFIPFLTIYLIYKICITLI